MLMINKNIKVIIIILELLKNYKLIIPLLLKLSNSFFLFYFLLEKTKVETTNIIN